MGVFRVIGSFLGWVFRGFRRKRRSAPLTEQQVAQRRYASGMSQIRKRAEKTTGGGAKPVGERTAARRLRKKLGVKKSR